MERGYIKFYRKIEDSVSWSRGLEYRGLMASILIRARRVKGAFRGVEIMPGQFAVVMSKWSEQTGVERTKLTRMLNNLKADEFINWVNVHKQFIIVSVLNWELYQENKKPVRPTNAQPTPQGPRKDRTTTAQPPHNHRTTEQERKNIRTKKIKPPYNPHGGEDFPTFPLGGIISFLAPKNRIIKPVAKPRLVKNEPKQSSRSGFCQREGHPPGIVQPEYNMPFEEFWACWVEITGKDIGKEAAWMIWAEREKYRGLPGLPYLQEALIDQSESEQWAKDKGKYIPSAKNWLKDGQWANKLPKAVGKLGSADFLKQAEEMRQQGRV